MNQQFKRIYGNELIFISSINRDGKGVTDLSKDDMSFVNNTIFKLTSLSISNKTFIASEMNAYVVKFKNE